jgi:hypothetical protein
MALELMNTSIVCADIEDIKSKTSTCTYIEIISEYAEDNSIEIEDIMLLLSPLIIDKIKYESSKLNLLKTEAVPEIIF